MPKDQRSHPRVNSTEIWNSIEEQIVSVCVCLNYIDVEREGLTAPPLRIEPPSVLGSLFTRFVTRCIFRRQIWKHPLQKLPSVVIFTESCFYREYNDSRIRSVRHLWAEILQIEVWGHFFHVIFDCAILDILDDGTILIL